MKRVNRLERLARREEKNIIKRIFFLSIVSFIIIIILFTVGIKALGMLGDFVTKVTGSKDTSTQNEEGLEIPIIDALPESTNSATLTVKGFASKGEKVFVFLDGEKLGESDIKNGLFSYENLRLKSGENVISVKTASGSVESDFSQAKTVTLDTIEPSLKIDFPSEGQEFSGNNHISVTGTTEKDVQIFAAGFLGNVNSDGKFSISVPLTDGANTLEVKALDEAGNSNTQTITVNFKK